MRIVRPNKLTLTDVYVDGIRMHYKPFERYLVSDWECQYLIDHTPNTHWEWSSFNSYERRYAGQDLTGKKVLLYRHTAVGDQLMISSVPRYLKTLYPECTVHLYCDPKMADLWYNNDFVSGGAIPLPIPFEAAMMYDYHILYEGMLENNGEFDQRCCYDDFFTFIGLNDVPPQYKRPYISVEAKDYHLVHKVMGLNLRGKYMVYHMSPANANRRYPVDKGMRFVENFLYDFPDWRCLVVGTGEEMKEAVPEHDRIVNLIDETPHVRSLLPIIKEASLVVGPDSSIMHMAAAFPDTPVISLWGLFHPDDRVKYYPNHHALTAFQVCPFAPCHNHDFQLPRHKCEQAVNFDEDRNYCAALDAIPSRAILEKAKEILQ